MPATTEAAHRTLREAVVHQVRDHGLQRGLELVGLRRLEVAVGHRLVDRGRRVTDERVDHRVEVEVLAFAISAIVWPLPRSVFNSAVVMPSALATESSSDASSRPRPSARPRPGRAEGPAPGRQALSGTAERELRPRLVDDVADRLWSAFVIAVMTVLMGDALLLGDIGDRGLAVAELGQQLLRREVQRLGGRVDEGRAGPGWPGFAGAVAAIAVALLGNCCAPDRPGTPMIAPPTPPAATAVTTAMPVTNRLRIMLCPLQSFRLTIFGPQPGTSLGV